MSPPDFAKQYRLLDGIHRAMLKSIRSNQPVPLTPTMFEFEDYGSENWTTADLKNLMDQLAIVFDQTEQSIRVFARRQAASATSVFRSSDGFVLFVIRGGNPQSLPVFLIGLPEHQGMNLIDIWRSTTVR